jgi:hypothetical protein
LLGESFRAHGNSTEVGSSALDSDAAPLAGKQTAEIERLVAADDAPYSLPEVSVVVSTGLSLSVDKAQAVIGRPLTPDCSAHWASSTFSGLAAALQCRVCVGNKDGLLSFL